MHNPPRDHHLGAIEIARGLELPAAQLELPHDAIRVEGHARGLGADRHDARPQRASQGDVDPFAASPGGLRLKRLGDEEAPHARGIALFGIGSDDADRPALEPLRLLHQRIVSREVQIPSQVICAHLKPLGSPIACGGHPQPAPDFGANVVARRGARGLRGVVRRADARRGEEQRGAQ
jgi:hypothetical protein